MSRNVDLAAERAALGSALVSSECAQEVCALLRPEHFFRDAHGFVLEALQAQLSAGEPTDHICVRGRLEAAGKLEKVGSDEGLWSFTDVYPTPENAAAYAKRVRQLAAVRAAVNAARSVLAEADGGVDDAVDFVSRAETAIGRAVEGHALGAEPVRLCDAVDDVFRDVIARAEGKRLGYRTGLGQLDRQLGGMVPGELIVLGGRPGQGKTSLALEIVMGVEQSSQLPVFVQSIEMPRAQLAQRIVSSKAGVPLKAIREGTLQRGHFADLEATADRLRPVRVWIDDNPRITVADFGRQLRRIQRRHGLAMGVVDYLQLIRPSDRHGSREQAVSEVSRSLKALAKELNVPILALASLNRGPENTASRDSRPKMSHLRESGGIESDADAVLLLYREEEYTPTTPEDVAAGKPDNRGVAEVIIDKNRNGPTGTVRLAWLEEYTRFANLEEWR
jgi:replicative DNA helicase